MEIEYTSRGFEYIDFKDLYGEECSLQQSSLAIYERPGTSAVWLGVDGNRMHLNEEQLEELMVPLNNWLKHGTFKLQSRSFKKLRRLLVKFKKIITSTFSTIPE